MKTSDKVSKIAARYMSLSSATLMGLTAKPSTCEITAAEIRTLAASCLAQDQHKGLRGLIRKVTGL
jgi:hypothetical protein